MKIITIYLLVVLFQLVASFSMDTNNNTITTNMSTDSDTTDIFDNYIEPKFPHIIYPSENPGQEEPYMSNDSELGTITFVVYFELVSSGLRPTSRPRITPLYWCGNKIFPSSPIWKEAEQNLKEAVNQWSFNNHLFKDLKPCTYCSRGITILVSFDLVKSKSEFVVVKSIIIQKK